MIVVVLEYRKRNLTHFVNRTPVKQVARIADNFVLQQVQRNQNNDVSSRDSVCVRKNDKNEPFHFDNANGDYKRKNTCSWTAAEKGTHMTLLFVKRTKNIYGGHMGTKMTAISCSFHLYTEIP